MINSKFYSIDSHDFEDDSNPNDTLTQDMKNHLSSNDIADEIVDASLGDDFIKEWANCCADKNWALKNNIRASLFKTLIRSTLKGDFKTMNSFLEKANMSKATVLNYLGRGSYADANSSSIPAILKKYGLSIDGISDFLEKHPEKTEIMLNMLPGGFLFESILRKLGKRID